MVGLSPFLLAVLPLLQAPPVPELAQSEATRPNILLIVSDDAGWADFGFHGSQLGATPRLDALADQGAVFEAAYVSASVCCPSRAGLITGRYQQRFGHEFNGPGNPAAGYEAADMGLAKEERTLGSLLQARGYRTGAIGKWHLGRIDGYHPNQRGFEHWFGFLGGSRTYWTISKLNPTRSLYRNDLRFDENSLRYLTDTLADEAVRFVEQSKTDPRPYFLYLAFNAPHTPMHALEADLERFASIEDTRRRTYAAMLFAMDRAIGRIVDAVEASGQAKRTLICFINDNGGATNNGSNNGDWRGRKGSKWEGGLRVPLLLHWPETIAAQTRVSQPVSSLDLAPTAIALAGEAAPDAKRASPAGPFDGVDLMPLLSSEEDREDLSARTFYWRRGIAAAVRIGDWKLVRVQGLSPQLMNLRQAPGETTNFAEKEAQRVQEMSRMLQAWEALLAPPRWIEGERWERNQLRKHQPEVDTREEEEEFP